MTVDELAQLKEELIDVRERQATAVKARDNNGGNEQRRFGYARSGCWSNVSDWGRPISGDQTAPPLKRKSN
jgi:hypothetical protein